MKAILLAAGYGKRLRPLTEHKPKCLIELNGKPLLDIWINKLINLGVDEILINTHYLAAQVEEFVSKHKFRDKIQLSHEKEIEGTAGTLIKNIDFFGSDDGLLIHADNFCADNLEKFILAHSKRQEICDITMLTFQCEHPKECGIVEVDKRKIITKFYEKVDGFNGNMANGAIYCISKNALLEISEKFSSAVDFSNEIVPNFLGRIYCYQSNQFFIDVGTIRNLIKAENFLKGQIYL
ncbi:nucleotidyltransferase family protein [Polynucleobacter sp. MG-6-Vaara-E2]|uniref:nucleotidyltransferase family protein n=1 Tax=Polynucleobacter sp. MG-6-Vaara-E2 TaxID=2576932 RepID=UPI001BFCE76A|nr:nucleotidyltransferase family protein [Polynucleobacter sp. MG-6-Vaara-E2]QWD96915.1 nucleotidyltransferase family protein [Polynucleobacter sp. MG-6-Vaara-E2]